MTRTIFSLFFAGVFFASCKKETTIIENAGEAVLTFDAKVGNADFSLNTDFSINSQTYRFNKLRYWVSNVNLIDVNGNVYSVPDSYYLLEETSPVAVQDGDYTYPAKKREDVKLLNIPKGQYKTIQFSIGVEKEYNDNLSLQKGELSQLNGMTNVSWMWHTSYIFSAIGGTVSNGTTSKNIIAETGLNSNYKTVSLDLAAPINIGGSTASTVLLSVDVAKILTGLDLFTTPTIGASQAAAMTQLANNYTQSFSVVSAK